VADAVRAALRPIARVARTATAWSRGAIDYFAPAASGIHVSYGHPRLPGPDDLAHGGIVKLQSLEREFPNTPYGFNVLYLVSSGLPEGAVTLARWAKRKGARVVLNQNGVAYPGWHGEGWERVNEPMRELLAMADHVFYQSAFCKVSADRFAGATSAPCEVLHNAVDTATFVPATHRPPRPLTLLLAGSHQHWYRFEVAARTVDELRRRGRQVKLLAAGRFAWRSSADASMREARQLVSELRLDAEIEFHDRYAQAAAPALYQRADILLHTKYNDPCPTVVIEALASGLPVVFSATGGVPELVGDAGVGVVTELSYERDYPPSPAALADAVIAVDDDRDRLSARARERAVSHFDVDRWLARHRAVFTAE
jgi:glycosyltransferase involved in cell wall biosynthesis